MDKHSIIIRPAKATFEEGLTFAKYLDEAFEGLFRLTLGRRGADIVAMAYTQPNHSFSYQNTIFAESDETIVGMVTGYTTEQQRGFSALPLRQAVGNYIFRQVSLSLLRFRLRFLGTHTDGDFYLQAIAVDEERRGQGIGSALLDAIEDRARTSGATRLFLDAAARNKSACRFYERHGVTIELKGAIVPFVPRFIVQMTKSL